MSRRNYTPHCGNVNPSHAGPFNSKLMVLAESPWVTEEALGKPLCGASGNKWNEWLFEAGLNRSEIRIENLYPWKPPSREITSVKDAEIIKWVHDLHQRIARLPDPGPNVIATMGNYATFALTGKGKVRAGVRNAIAPVESNASEAEKKAGITALRGSIYLYRDLKGRLIKVIPTIHPAGVLQMPKWEKRCVYDWKRIARESQDRVYRVPQRNHIIDPDEWQVEQFTKFVEQNAIALKMAVDIETWGRTLSCVGFSYHPLESITIPTLEQRQREAFLPYVKRLCEAGTQLVLCNGTYDWYWLEAYGVGLKKFLWDVQLMHHAFDPVDNHSLNYLASLYTNQPYWKDEAKDAEEIIKYAKKADALWVYNGIDCCVTLELQPILEKKLRERGLYSFYLKHYQELLEPLLRMMRHGVRVDIKAQKDWAKQLRADMVKLRRELEAGAGENLFATDTKTFFREPTSEEWDRLLNKSEFDPEDYQENGAPKAKFIDREARKALLEESGVTYMINGINAGKIRDSKQIDKKTFSKEKLFAFFHDKLGLPKQYRRRKGKGMTQALDEGAVRKLTAKWPNKIGNYGNLLLAYREKERELNYLRGAWDKDSRIRCSYKMATEAGRLASSKNPMGKGYNLQNLKR